MKSSLFAILMATSIISGADAALRVSNNTSRSYAKAYEQVANMQYNAEFQQQQAAAAVNNLPVSVANSNTAAAIARGDDSAGVSMEMLDNCASIYPGGEFAWDKPDTGLRITNTDTCVAIVEMRAVYGTEDIVLARAKVAAGDSVDCNISEFPESGYTIQASEIIFPADKEPTVEDVRRAMNAEQKENSALKIAASTVIGGVLGNMAGRNDMGNSSTFGTDKGKLKGAAVGALSGAAIMTAATQTGKVAGDVILSSGVNAAMGGVMGNMVSAGKSALLIQDCQLPDTGDNVKCLLGYVQEKSTLPFDKQMAFFDIDTEKIMVCDADGTKCENTSLIGYRFADYASVEAARSDSYTKARDNSYGHYCFDSFDRKLTPGSCANGDGTWVVITDGGRPGKTTSAAIEWSAGSNKLFGYSEEDYSKWKKAAGKNATVYARNNNGKLSKSSTLKMENFYPLYETSADGGIIDIDNRARMKSTITGAGIGAGLGGFTAYQGAQDDIDQRWVSAVQEYRDSLQKIYCGTGTRYLSSYNDVSFIPAMK